MHDDVALERGTAIGAARARAGVGAGVTLLGVSKHYGGVIAVDDIKLDIGPGELMTLLGPSGSGKTTTLMMIAGFTEPSAGEIRIGERLVTHLPAHRRDIGVVFQHYALFPHMTVAENIAFPLQMRGMSAAEIARRVGGALDLVQMGTFGERYPGQLSGGQQQRVAFARAIVFDPPVLLLDEPLGALDKKLRDAMQVELKALHAKLGVTMIYVTHDQTEALALSDRVAVMEGGRIAQLGSPRDLYERPVSAFVADFIGESSFLDGRIAAIEGGECVVVMGGGLACRAALRPGLTVGAPVHVVLRPERVLVGGEAESLPNRFAGRIEDVSYIGEAIKYRVALSPDQIVTAKVPNRGEADLAGDGEQRVSVGWRPQDTLVFARPA